MQKMQSKLVKIVRRLAGAILVIIAVMLLIACLIYPPEYVYRVLVWQNADVYDYQKFSERHLQSQPPVFTFAEAPDEAGVTEVIEALVDVDFESFMELSDTQAFIVIKDDATVYEGYFNGTERDSVVTSFSVAKSFDSALIGIAIEEGYINSVNDPITDYLPELAGRDQRFEAITIRNLLMMSSGIEYAEFPFFHGDDALTYYYPNLRRLALEETEIGDSPGEYFLYNNYHPLLLGVILERATGVSVTEYLQTKIWEPLGMAYDGSWSIDSQASGFEKMESGINARAIDFAKFGQLYLHSGNWNGRQVVPAEWVAESTEVDPFTNNAAYYASPFGVTIYDSGEGYYKYMWYGLYRGEEGEFDFFAAGNFGQFIYVSPDNNLVMVRNGEEFWMSLSEWVALFYQFASEY